MLDDRADDAPNPLPWWATVPLEVLFPRRSAPQPTPTGLKAPGDRDRARVRRQPGPGRPSVMTDSMIAEANDLYASGNYTAEDIARMLGVSRSTVFRYLEY